eukprot:TRINITY_DN80722_c0_g1_i1.p1 TRINITY_DN80722_c0_g1~~TRINITY_DN80722_c0_g1_i1.p1  ORF type:complete len:248 (-),score=57.40 TRINITY_DN80722_c0_g1_i1:74-817(-)
MADYHLDAGCRQSLDRLLRPEAKPMINAWMQQAGAREKRNIVRLERIVEASQMGGPSVLSGLQRQRWPGEVPRVAELATQRSLSTPALPRRVEAKPFRQASSTSSLQALPSDTPSADSLRALLRPELHSAIQPWLRQAEPGAKRSVVKLNRMAEPSLIERMGRPGEGAAAVAKAREEPQLVGRRNPNFMGRDGPTPSDLQSRMEEDHARANLDKPGGSRVNHYDSFNVVQMKVAHRNRAGTIRGSLG